MNPSDTVNSSPASHRRRNLAIVALIVIVALVGYVSLTLRPQEVVFYRVINDHTLVVRAQANVLLWPHLSSLNETATEVAVTVSGIGIPAPSTEELYDVTVVLAQPLGDRRVIDGNSGERVQLQTAGS
jgi:hypothetical protein